MFINRLAGDLYKEQEEEEAEWLLNLMRKLARSLRLLAQKVDRETTRLDPVMVRETPVWALRLLVTLRNGLDDDNDASPHFKFRVRNLTHPRAKPCRPSRSGSGSLAP